VEKGQDTVRKKHSRPVGEVVLLQKGEAWKGRLRKGPKGFPESWQGVEISGKKIPVKNVLSGAAMLT